MAFRFGDIFVNQLHITLGGVDDRIEIQHFDSTGTYLDSVTLAVAEVLGATDLRVGGVTVGLNGHLYCLVQTGHSNCFVGEFDETGTWVGLVGADLAITFPPAPGGSTFIDLSPLVTAANGDLIGVVVRGFIGANYFRMATDGTLVTTSPVITDGDQAHAYQQGSDDDVYTLHADWTGELLSQDTSTAGVTSLATLSQPLGDYDNVFDEAYNRYTLWKVNDTGSLDVSVDVYTKDFSHVVSHSGGSFDAALNVFAGRVTPCSDAVWFLVRDDAASPTRPTLYRIDLTTGAVTSVLAPAPAITDPAANRLTICKDPRGQSTDAITSVGPTLWVEADSPTGLSSGDELHVWPEAGAIAIDGADSLTIDPSAGLSSGPVWSTDGPCGRPVVQFRGLTEDGLIGTTPFREGEGLEYPVADTVELYPASEFSVVAVVRMANYGTDPGDVGFQFWHDADDALELHRPAGGSPEIRLAGVDSSTNALLLSQAHPEGDWAFVCLRGQGGYPEGSGFPSPDQPGTIRLRVNGTEQTANWAGHLAGGLTGCQWLSGASATAQAEMLALLVFPRYLTDEEVDALRTEYFACRYPCIFEGGGGGGAGLFSWVFACC